MGPAPDEQAPSRLQPVHGCEQVEKGDGRVARQESGRTQLVPCQQLPGQKRPGEYTACDQTRPHTIRSCVVCRAARPLHGGTAQNQQDRVCPQLPRYGDRIPVVSPMRVLHPHPIGGNEQPEQRSDHRKEGHKPILRAARQTVAPPSTSCGDTGLSHGLAVNLLASSPHTTTPARRATNATARLTARQPAHV